MLSYSQQFAYYWWKYWFEHFNENKNHQLLSWRSWLCSYRSNNFWYLLRRCNDGVINKIKSDIESSADIWHSFEIYLMPFWWIKDSTLWTGLSIFRHTLLNKELILMNMKKISQNPRTRSVLIRISLWILKTHQILRIPLKPETKTITKKKIMSKNKRFLEFRI